jgi:hypothetical protein
MIMPGGAWQELSRADADAAWDRFCKRFRWRRQYERGKGPYIREPIPSVTWSIAHAFGPQREQLEVDLNLKMHRALRRCTKPDLRLFALDWEHPCYWFWPRRFTDAADREAWKVPVLPDGDYYIFLAENFGFGLFGHPWEQTLCVFGQDLLTVLEQDRPLLLAKRERVRQDGKPFAGAHSS